MGQVLRAYVIHPSSMINVVESLQCQVFPKRFDQKRTKREVSTFMYLNKVKKKKLKVKIKDTKMTSNYQLWTYLNPSPIVFIIDTEHVNARWVNDIYIICTLYQYDDVTRSSNIERWEQDV